MPGPRTRAGAVAAKPISSAFLFSVFLFFFHRWQGRFRCLPACLFFRQRYDERCERNKGGQTAAPRSAGCGPPRSQHCATDARPQTQEVRPPVLTLSTSVTPHPALNLTQALTRSRQGAHWRGSRPRRGPTQPGIRAGNPEQGCRTSGRGIRERISKLSVTQVNKLSKFAKEKKQHAKINAHQFQWKKVSHPGVCQRPRDDRCDG